ncbi:hypothetical protein D3C80_1873210 [compost metagenome]
MYLYRQIVIAVKQLDQQRETGTFSGNALAAEPIPAELLTDLIQALSGQLTVNNRGYAVRMVSDHPAFSDMAFRQI